MNRLFNKIKNHFIPHTGNNHEPHFFRDKSIFFFFSLLIVIELVFLVQVFVIFDKTNFLASVLPGVLTAITNEDRASNNAGTLTTNELLQKAAQLKANDMAKRGYFAHNSPDGLTPWYWLDKVGYKYRYAGENLAVNFFESRDVAQAWMNSPTHRANIVKKEYTEIGIAVADGVFEGQNTVFVVQFFGTPKPTLPTIIKTPIVNASPTQKPTTKPATKPTVTQTAPTDTKVLSEETTDTTPSVIIEDSVKDSSVVETTENAPSLKEKVQEILTSPLSSVAYTYRVIAMLFVVALLVFLIKTERRHPLVIAKGSAMVAFIVFLMILNLKIYSNHTIVPLDIAEISVVAS